MSFMHTNAKPLSWHIVCKVIFYGSEMQWESLFSSSVWSLAISIMSWKQLICNKFSQVRHKKWQLMLILNSHCIFVQTDSGCFFLVEVGLWSVCIDEQQISAFAIATVCLRASLYTVLEKCRPPSRWPHYEGRQENQVIALGKWRESILKSGMGTHKKEQTPERRKIKTYRIVKTSRGPNIWGSAVVPVHRLESSYVPLLHLESSSWKQY